MTRHGKIARLPRELRDQLNSRFENGESAVRLAEWLNGLPEVKKVLADHFGGRAISEQNMSEWKAGGYRDWQARQEMLAQARELAADAGELSEATSGRLTDHLATVLAARYAGVMVGWNGEESEEFTRKLRPLRAVCQDIVELRRGDHSGARLGLEQERLEREREKADEEVFEQFKKWANTQELRDCLCRDWISPEEREARLREIFGMAGKEDDEAQQGTGGMGQGTQNGVPQSGPEPGPNQGDRAILLTPPTPSCSRKVWLRIIRERFWNWKVDLRATSSVGLTCRRSGGRMDLSAQDVAGASRGRRNEGGWFVAVVGIKPP